MGIHAKYDLTKYGYQSKEPVTYYSVDSYVVSVFDGYTEFEHTYDSWKEASTYFQRVMNDAEDEYIQISITGLVFN